MLSMSFFIIKRSEIAIAVTISKIPHELRRENPFHQTA